MDWLGRVELRTDESPLGKVPVGEIVVVEKKRSKAFTGVYATRKVCLQVLLFFLYGLALRSTRRTSFRAHTASDPGSRPTTPSRPYVRGSWTTATGG